MFTASFNGCVIILKELKKGLKNQGWTSTYILMVPSLSEKFIKNSQQNLPISQYLGTKLDMLFKIANLVEIVMILEK